MKKLIVPIIVGLVGIVGTLLVFLPSISRGNKLRELSDLQLEVVRCEQIKVDNHIKADEIRKELGLITGTLQQPVKQENGAIQLLDKYISGTKTENVNQSQQ